MSRKRNRPDAWRAYHHARWHERAERRAGRKLSDDVHAVVCHFPDGTKLVFFGTFNYDFGPVVPSESGGLEMEVSARVVELVPTADWSVVPEVRDEGV